MIWFIFKGGTSGKEFENGSKYDLIGVDNSVVAKGFIIYIDHPINKLIEIDTETDRSLVVKMVK